MKLFSAVIYGTLAALGLILTACGEKDDPFERINKLRALGVTATPAALVPTGVPGQTFALTVYAAVPLGEQVTVEAFQDDAARYATAVQAVVVPGSESYKDYAKLRLYQVSLTLPVPPIKPSELPAAGFLALRYGIKLTSGSEEEKIVGNTLLYPADAPQLLWQPPTAEILSPKAEESLGNTKIEVKANVASTNANENLRLSWFVTSGNLRNRRAKETVWEKADSGAQTLILMVRGLKSGTLAAPQILNVNL